MKARFAATIAAISISCSAQAAVVVQQSELPLEIQNCFNSLSCSSDSGPGFQFSSFNTLNMAAFQYTENNTDKWLIRYGLVSPSNKIGQSLDGSLWLTANQTYDLNNSWHNFTLYTEKVTPSSLNTPLWGNTWEGGTSVVLSLDNTGLANSGGTFEAGIAWDGQDYSIGSLKVSNPLYCLTPGCSAGAQLNLINLKYNTNGELSFISDHRNLLFSQYHPGGELQYFAQQYPVPLPAGLWLFASGIIGLGALTRKHKALA